MHEEQPSPITPLLLVLVCCGLPLLAVALSSAGGLAIVGASLRTAVWPLAVVLALVVLTLGVVVWRRRAAACPVCGQPGASERHDHGRREAELTSGKAADRS